MEEELKVCVCVWGLNFIPKPKPLAQEAMWLRAIIYVVKTIYAGFSAVPGSFPLVECLDQTLSGCLCKAEAAQLILEDG